MPNAIRVTIVANWEGIPSVQTQDWVTTSYSSMRKNPQYEDVIDYFMKNNLVLN